MMFSVGREENSKPGLMRKTGVLIRQAYVVFVAPGY